MKIFENKNEKIILAQGERSLELDFYENGELVHSHWTTRKLAAFAAKLPERWQLFYLKQLPNLGAFEKLPRELKQAFVAIDLEIVTEVGTVDKVPTDSQKSLVKAIFNALAKNFKLPALRRVEFETLPSCPGQGYIHSCDWFSARFLPGRNVVIVEAEELDNNNRERYGLKAVLQIGEWSQLYKSWLKLQAEIDSAEDDQWARWSGVEAFNFVEDFLFNNKLPYEVEDLNA